MKACCGFGHREVFENISEQIEEAVFVAIKDGCETFYTGAMGEFDRLFSSAIWKAKLTHTNIRLICVKPYITQELNENRDYYTAATMWSSLPKSLVFTIKPQSKRVTAGWSITAISCWAIPFEIMVVHMRQKSMQRNWKSIGLSKKKGKRLLQSKDCSSRYN